VPRYFIINSAIPAFQAADPDLAAHQVPLLQSEHPSFLRHDSFLDCSEMLGGIAGSELEDLHDADPRIHCGDVSTNARRRIRHVISESILLTEREKGLLLGVW
jgi:hypothetical protein